MARCTNDLATRPILYTDTLRGEQVCRDDMWAVKTAELNAIQDRVEALEKAARLVKVACGDAANWNGATYDFIVAIDEALALCDAPKEG